MSERATVIVTATPNPNEMASVQGYLQGVMPLLLGAGGKLVKRIKIGKVIKGAPSGMVLFLDTLDTAPIQRNHFAHENIRPRVHGRSHF